MTGSSNLTVEQFEKWLWVGGVLRALFTEEPGILKKASGKVGRIRVVIEFYCACIDENLNRFFPGVIYEFAEPSGDYQIAVGLGGAYLPQKDARRKEIISSLLKRWGENNNFWLNPQEVVVCLRKLGGTVVELRENSPVLLEHLAGMQTRVAYEIRLAGLGDRRGVNKEHHINKVGLFDGYTLCAVYYSLETLINRLRQQPKLLDVSVLDASRFVVV